MTRRTKLITTLSILAWVVLLALPVPQAHAAFFITPDAYWQFGEATQPFIDEIGGSGVNDFVDVPWAGAAPFTTNATKDATGQVGEAVAFGGTSGLYSLDGGAEVWDWAADASFAIEVWMKRAVGGLDTEGETEVIIGRNDFVATSLHWFIGLRYNAANGTTPRVIAQLIDADNEGSGVTLNGSNTSYTEVVDGTWHHIILVRDAVGMTIKLYVDGQLEDTATGVDYTGTANGFESAVASLDIGWLGISTGEQTDYAFNGSVDQVALYGTDLSAAEVNQIYQIGNNGYALDDDFAPIYPAGTTDLGVSALGYAVSVNAVPAANPAPTAYSLDNAAPAGMSVNNSGQVSWMPTTLQTGVADFTVTATNTMGSGSGDYTIDIVDPCVSGLDAYWHLEEDGTSGYDNAEGTSSLDADCATGGCPTQDSATGKVNNAQIFAGAEGIDVPAAAGADQIFDWGNTDSFTIELWMKRAAGGLAVNGDTEVLIGRWDAPNQIQWWVGVRNIGGNLRIAAKLIANGAENDVLIADGPTGTDVVDGNWHHVALVRDYLTTETRLYVDGVLEDTDTHDYTGSFATADADLNIGYLTDAGGFELNGSLDEVAIYSEALDADVLLQHATMNAGRGYCNSAPSITTTADTDADPTQDYTYDADATDAEGDSVTWSLTTAPTGMTISSSTGVVSWGQADVATAAGTSVPVTIQVVDAYGGIGTQSYSIAVSGSANVAPTITGQETLSVREGADLTITVADLTITDPDSTTFTLTVQDGTGYTRSGATITPDAGTAGTTLTVPVSVNDGIAESSTYNLSVTVTSRSSGGGGGSGCFIESSSMTDTPETLAWWSLLSLAGLLSAATLGGRKN